MMEARRGGLTMWHSMDVRYSRFQVITEGRPAWAKDDRGSVVYFDGLRFWGPTRRGKTRLVASWQAPSCGWEHESECSCHLCASERERAARSLEADAGVAIGR